MAFPTGALGLGCVSSLDYGVKTARMALKESTWMPQGRLRTGAGTHCAALFNVSSESLGILGIRFEPPGMMGASHPVDVLFTFCRMMKDWELATAANGYGNRG